MQRGGGVEAETTENRLMDQRMMNLMAMKKIEHKAPRKAFLTLDELAAFVQEAMRAGASGREVVAAAVSFGSKLQGLSVEVPVATGDVDKQL